MASQTPIYGMAIFDFGDQLDSPLNVQKEIDRFMVIDKQLYAIYKIFGSGVIDGWNVEDNGFTQNNGISVIVSAGTGIIRYLACQTTFPVVLDGLPPNSRVYVYAVLRGSTARDRLVDFTYSFVELTNNAILLAVVATGQAAVESINNNFRQRIGFEQIIKDEIDAHRHRGTPSKIDLKNETKNQLPGAKIEGVDADKITSGVFDIERIGQLSHDELDFNGVLTHAQLDSFVKTLKENNKQLLGEVTSVNMLKTILFLKYKYADVDSTFINELALIPGISPDEFIDFDATTAFVNKDQGCISGKPPKKGEFVDITWDSQTSFVNAFKLTNVSVRNGRVTLQRDDSAKEVIENFEGVSAAGDNIPGFVKTSELTLDEFKVIAEGSTTLRTEGFYSGKVSTTRKYRALLTKTFASPKDWTNFNQLVVKIKTLTTNHGPVFGYFVNEDGDTKTTSSSLLLLAADEVTDSPDAGQNDFEERVFDLTEEVRDKVTKFVVFTDDTCDSFEFYMDEIYVENTSLYKPQGSVNLRYSSNSGLTFHSVFFETETPDKTKISVRVRAAGSSSLLSRAAYSLPVRSGDVVALPGTDAEIEVTLLTDDRTITPTLDLVKLRLLVESEAHGFDVRKQTDWALGEASNIDIVTTSGDLASLELTSPLNVDGLSFSHLQAIREIDDDNNAVLGFSGVNLPISPRQALDWENNPIKRFNEPVSVIRRFDKTYVVADKNNDRVLLMANDGTLIRGFGSVNVVEEDFYPLSAVYNPENGVLTIVLSKGVEKDDIDITKISLYLATTELRLSASDKLVESQKSDQIVEIQLTSDKIAQLVDFSDDLLVDFRSGAFADDFDENDNAESLLGVRGMPVYIGNFIYMDGIRHPVYANIISNNDWIVCNSDIEYTSPEEEEVGSVTALRSSPSSVAVTPNSQSSATISGGTAPYTIKTGPNSSVATAEISGDTVTIKGVATGTTSVIVKDSSTSPLALAIPLSVVAGTATTTSTETLAAIVQFNPDTLETTFSSNAISFSDFTLGAAIEFNEERIAVAGIFKDPSSITSNAGGGDTSGTTVPTGTTAKEKYRLAAVAALAGYRGIVAIIDKPSNNMVFKYISPDGLFASDVDINEDGELVVAESSFADANGRVIVLDNFGNIIRLFGNRMFNAVNDAKAIGDGHILISV